MNATPLLVLFGYISQFISWLNEWSGLLQLFVIGWLTWELHKMTGYGQKPSTWEIVGVKALEEEENVLVNFDIENTGGGRAEKVSVETTGYPYDIYCLGEKKGDDARMQNYITVSGIKPLLGHRVSGPHHSIYPGQKLSINAEIDEEALECLRYIGFNIQEDGIVTGGVQLTREQIEEALE